MTEKEKQEIEYIMANLRHLYENMINGRVNKPVELADGLLSPSIKRLEKLLNGCKDMEDEAVG